jgi:hypothetical protein
MQRVDIKCATIAPQIPSDLAAIWQRIRSDFEPIWHRLLDIQCAAAVHLLRNNFAAFAHFCGAFPAMLKDYAVISLR